jgi:hypothetical protein
LARVDRPSAGDAEVVGVREFGAVALLGVGVLFVIDKVIAHVRIVIGVLVCSLGALLYVIAYTNLGSAHAHFKVVQLQRPREMQQAPVGHLLAKLQDAADVDQRLGVSRADMET